MEIIIKNEKFIMKDEITGREEHDSGILHYLTKLGNLKDTNLLSQMFFDEEFNKCALKLVSFMSLSPKMSVDEILDLNSTFVMELKVKCLIRYMKSIEDMSKALENDEDLKKMTILSEKLTDFSISSGTNLSSQQIRLNLSKS